MVFGVALSTCMVVGSFAFLDETRLGKIVNRSGHRQEAKVLTSAWLEFTPAATHDFFPWPQWRRV